MRLPVVDATVNFLHFKKLQLMVAINKWLLFIKILFYLRDDCISAIFYVNRFEDDLINFINMYSCTRHNLSSNTCFYTLRMHIITIRRHKEINISIWYCIEIKDKTHWYSTKVILACLKQKKVIFSELELH